MQGDPVGAARHVAEQVGPAEDARAMHDRYTSEAVLNGSRLDEAPQGHVELHLHVAEQVRRILAFLCLLALLGDRYFGRVRKTEAETPAKPLLAAPGFKPLLMAMIYSA
jgi:hypothetical protein